MPQPRVLAIVQAGGEGSRMDVLTRERAKPALPFAGHYQLVDFALSSIAHSGIDEVWLSVQYQANNLARHVASGRPWDLDRTRGGLRFLVPEEGAGAATQTGFARGNADDLYRSRDEIERVGADVVLVLSADSVFALDLRTLVDEHLAAGSECTIVTVEATRTQARQKLVVTSGRDGLVVDLAYKPDDLPGTTIAAEIFAYEPGALVEVLERLRRERHTGADDEDTEDTGLGDFGEHLLPELVSRGRVGSFALPGYWRDLGTPEEYLAAHRDVLAGRVPELADAAWPILTRWPELPPARVRAGALVEDAIVTAGCDVRGRVRRSVLGPGVVVEKDALVEDSVVFAGTVVRSGARVSTTILDSEVVVGRGARVGARARSTRPRGGELTLVGRESRIAARAVVPPGSRLEPGTTA